MALRVVFMGTPDFAVPAFQTLLGSTHEIAAVYCQPPRPAGRGMALRPSPVQQLAEHAKLPVLTPVSLRAVETAAAFAGHQADVAVVVAYGLLLPAPSLASPKHGCLNLHPSKLPRWRGAAPIQRTLMAGDVETAICVMRMEAGLDTGPVCLAETLALPADLTAGMLHDLAASRGAALMLRALDILELGQLSETPQAAAGVTYAAKIDKAAAHIDWTLSAEHVHNHIRGLSPFPGAWFEVSANGRPERIKVLRAELAKGRGAPGQVLDGQLRIACGDGAVQLKELQRAGRKPMPVEELLRGFTLAAGGTLR